MDVCHPYSLLHFPLGWDKKMKFSRRIKPFVLQSQAFYLHTAASMAYLGLCLIHKSVGNLLVMLNVIFLLLQIAAELFLCFSTFFGPFTCHMR